MKADVAISAMMTNTNAATLWNFQGKKKQSQLEQVETKRRFLSSYEFQAAVDAK
jgi:hypothetical protein